MKYGIFIESGVNYSWLSAKYEPQTNTVVAYGNTYTYTAHRTANQMFLSVPFLAGYKMPKGKVRFQGSLGYSVNINFSNYEIIKRNGHDPFSVTNKDRRGDLLTFGAGISAIVKAGISLPLTDKITLDILPSARYQFVSFRRGSMDIIKDTYTDDQKWLAGLDISFMWALDNAPREVFNEKKNNKSEDFTYKYYTDEEQNEVKKPAKPWGYKNYVYLEIAGAGQVYSVNYERDLFDKGVLSILVRGGFGVVGPKYGIPVGGSILVGRGTKKFEAGVYAAFENLLLDEFNTNIVPAIAFRWVSQEHFCLRLSVMSHIVAKTGEIVPGVGLSIGGGF